MTLHAEQKGKWKWQYQVVFLGCMRPFHVAELYWYCQNSLCCCTTRHHPLIFLKASHSTPPHISLHPAFCPASYPSLNLLSIIRLLRSIFHFPLSFPGSALFLESISACSLKSLSFFMATLEESSKITNITYWTCLIFLSSSVCVAITDCVIATVFT